MVIAQAITYSQNLSSHRAMASFLLLGALPVTHAEAPAIRIRSLSNNDPVYLQHQDLLQEYLTTVSHGDDPGSPLFMRYRPAKTDTLISIAARLSLPYSTIATLNRLPSTLLPDADLLIPTQPGVFLYSLPFTGMEQVLHDRLRHRDPELIVRGISESEILMYRGEDFTPAERTRFLTISFIDPLPSGRISSRFGPRINPVTGNRGFHNGLDLSAPFGTPVVSAGPGVVRSVTRDRLLGLLVIIDHADGYATRYAHLQEVFTREGALISAGEVLGRVGSTGFSTGPHLHFEVRRYGTPRDPEPYIR
jgi:murein DD-endopeptidase MepM/ murein hydrolase activator NlpD